LSFPELPDPVTWTPGQTLTESWLRADPGNLAWLLTKRPLLICAQLTTGQSIPGSTVELVTFDSENVDNWNGHTIGSAYYNAPLAGWYLAEGTVIFTAEELAGYWTCGIEAVQDSVTTTLSGNILCGNEVNVAAPACADLVQLNPGTADKVAMYAEQTASGSPLDLSTAGAYFTCQWAGMPTSSFSDTVVPGVVVTSPQPAAAWPPGSGTLLTGSGVAAGGSVITVASTTGMVAGGSLGLDYYLGQPVTPAAEAVTIAGISGGTVTTSPAAYPHGGTATPGYVAVPVSAAWMNQQVRDIINFLAYPPMVRLHGASQTLDVQTFPASTTISFTGSNLDNFSGWNGSTTYTFPVSGVYYVYGQVPFEAAVNNYSAGISVSGGTVMWGDSIRAQTALLACATVRKHIRVTAGQTLTLHACVTNNNVALQNTATTYATLIAIFRGF